ncbi:MAG: DUF975 family protein [Phycisphaerae bacterium]|nr:DUF975 family protein [Phycisphaerae bacterium]
MRQWYCFIGGQQYGPVSEDDLRAWIRQGRVRQGDQVWTEGMGQWAAAGSVPGLFDDAGVIPVQTAGVQVSSSGGTGGRTPNAELNLQAREILRGRWGLAIGFCLLLFLLNMGINMLPYVGGIASLILSGALQLGAVIFFLTFIRAGQAEIGMLFAGFRNFGSALAAYLLVVLFVALWLVGIAMPGIVLGIIVSVTTEPEAGLAVGIIAGGIPGYIAAIIAQLSYFQTFYLLADNPSIGAMGAIRMSKGIMQGYKWKLLCLGLRYFCWALLCIFTLGIGFIFLTPYMSAGYARFYDDLQPPVGGNPIPE